jgi:hypothetical protein
MYALFALSVHVYYVNCNAKTQMGYLCALRQVKYFSLHGLIQENLNIYFESIGIECFDYWYFSCIQRKNEIHLPRHCKSQSLVPWYFETSAYFRNVRLILTKFRLSEHKLLIEIG